MSDSLLNNSSSKKTTKCDNKINTVKPINLAALNIGRLHTTNYFDKSNRPIPVL